MCQCVKFDKANTTKGVLRLQQFQSTLSDESVKSTRQDRTVVWVFVESLYVGVEEIYKFVFLLVNH